jgi:hypothetical protein
MSSIGPSNQQTQQIQNIDNELQRYIQQAEAGQKVDVSSIQSQINALLKNPNIPLSVQQSLQQAYNELKQMQTAQGGVWNLQSAKMQLDALLTGAEAEQPPSGGTAKTGEGSLGGGGSEG